LDTQASIETKRTGTNGAGTAEGLTGKTLPRRLSKELAWCSRSRQGEAGATRTKGTPRRSGFSSRAPFRGLVANEEGAGSYIVRAGRRSEEHTSELQSHL